MPITRFSAIFSAVALLLGRSPQPASTLTPADITQAIQDGAAGKHLQATCSHIEPGDIRHGPTELRVSAEGPIGRIMRAAEFAAQLHKPLTPADVSPAMAAPTVQVSAALMVPTQPSTAPPRLPALVATMDGKPIAAIDVPRLSLPPAFPESRSGEAVLWLDLKAIQAAPDADLEISGAEASGKRTWKCSITAAEKMKLK